MEGVAVNTSFWTARRVLVTGHSGFKGAWMALWLTEMGAEVAGYADGVPTIPSLYELARVESRLAETTTADVRDPLSLAKALQRFQPDVVFHLAAQPLVRRGLAEPVATYETNVLGTINLLEAVRVTECVRVVVNVTTDKVYANNEWEWSYRENEPLGGADPYSSSKACSELVTAAYRAAFFTGGRGPATATARAGNVIGGGDWAEDRLLTDVLAALRAGDAVILRNPRATRPWQHVLSCTDGYFLLAERLWEDPLAVGAWNFGPPDDDARPVTEIVDRLAALWGRDLQVVAPSVPQPTEASALKLDSSRARHLLGWTPRWRLDQALEAVVAWHQALDAGEDAQTTTIRQIREYAASEVPAR